MAAEWRNTWHRPGQSIGNPLVAPYPVTESARPELGGPSFLTRGREVHAVDITIGEHA